MHDTDSGESIDKALTECHTKTIIESPIDEQTNIAAAVTAIESTSDFVKTIATEIVEQATMAIDPVATVAQSSLDVNVTIETTHPQTE